MEKYTRLLTIAGSDSGGGAGIQADLKTFSACGCYGMSAITALTAQNTLGVTDIYPVATPFLEAQLRAVLDDIGVDAIKIGMLHSTEVIECVAAILKEYKCMKVVLDPVMVATSGHKLIEDDAIAALKEVLFPAVQLITPNIPEAQLISGKSINGAESLESVARELAERHDLAVLLKAGHLTDEYLEDVLVDGDVESRYRQKRLETKNTHGTGCTLSSAIASFWGRGFELAEAVNRAEGYLHGAITKGAEYSLGQGHGPVHHFHQVWK
ncbi:bifunctional hydroxymethylpyrimidine kinase/phosphomethylpyrimidine kinase [Desulfosediminicola ganghwensis]|uniref:bifunctional hydroxymethylpyrimidine kinase/phosphomethylpyrimidine kinase n=1 Tax=Desulfosediminicola ganghwensis TaxID=2569540 RepID=UPI0010AD1B63|nr:bifunctional hydroxymethylpyrimidine kinase/phosphomethylpyrimidine kinase [Desulfosediminicola ganghwensis]